MRTSRFRPSLEILSYRVAPSDLGGLATVMGDPNTPTPTPTPTVDLYDPYADPVIVQPDPTLPEAPIEDLVAHDPDIVEIITSPI